MCNDTHRIVSAYAMDISEICRLKTTVYTPMTSQPHIPVTVGYNLYTWRAFLLPVARLSGRLAVRHISGHAHNRPAYEQKRRDRLVARALADPACGLDYLDEPGSSGCPRGPAESGGRRRVSADGTAASKSVLSQKSRGDLERLPVPGRPGRPRRVADTPPTRTARNPSPS